jgi:mannose-6-phosphate isomerase-like protein (cupin superfamily)
MLVRHVVLGLLTLVVAVAASAQTTSGSGTIDLTAAQVQAMARLGVNNALKSIDAGKHTVFFVMETRKGTKEAGSGITHAEITEIYLIVEGSATLRTGGRLVDSYALYDGGRGGPLHAGILPGTTNAPRFPSPSLTGKAEGGVARKVGVGDLIVIPPNTVHAWDSVDTPTLAYVTVRIDPEHRLHAGYTHPSLK